MGDSTDTLRMYVFVYDMRVVAQSTAVSPPHCCGQHESQLRQAVCHAAHPVGKGSLLLFCQPPVAAAVALLQHGGGRLGCIRVIVLLPYIRDRNEWKGRMNQVQQYHVIYCCTVCCTKPFVRNSVPGTGILCMVSCILRHSIDQVTKSHSDAQAGKPIELGARNYRYIRRLQSDT